MSNIDTTINVSGKDYYWSGWEVNNLLVVNRYLKMSNLTAADVIWAENFQATVYYEDNTNSGLLNLSGLQISIVEQKRISKITLTCTFDDAQSNTNRAILLIGTSNSLSTSQDINTIAGWVNSGLMKVFNPLSGSNDTITANKAIFDLVQNAAANGKDFKYLYFACYCVKNNAGLSTSDTYSKV